MKKILYLYIILSIAMCLIIGCAYNVPSSSEIEDSSIKVEEYKSNDSKEDNKEDNNLISTNGLQWRIEEELVSEEEGYAFSHLYLQSKDNPEVEIKLDYLVGSVFSLEEDVDAFPKDGVLPIYSWIGGGGVQVVVRFIEPTVAYVMFRGIGDHVLYGTKWDEFEPWFKLKIQYDENNKITSIKGEELTKMNEGSSADDFAKEQIIDKDSTKSNKFNSIIQSFYGEWEIEEVVCEPEQHNYIGMMDQIIGTKVILREDYYECGDEVINDLSLELEKIDDDIYFPVMYGSWADDAGRGYKEMYALHLKEGGYTVRYMYYMDGEIWSDYKFLLFKLKKVD